MSPDPVVTLRWLVGGSPLLARLFFASLELAGLALLIALLVRFGRVRSPRVVSLLWLVVLVKPLASLAAGSPLPILLLEPGEAQFAETADTPAVAYVPPEAPRSGWAASWDPDDPLGSRASFEPSVRPAPVSPPPGASSDLLPTEAFSEGSLPRAIAVAWLVGVALCMALHLRARLRLWRIVCTAEAPSARVLSRYRTIASELRLRRIPRLLMTEALDSPAITGLLRPVVLVPSWLAATADDPKLAWALRHELTHWMWLDPVAVLVRDAVGILFYFHPVAWLAGKQHTEAVELACDRAMLRTDADAASYAEQLYEMLKGIRWRRRTAVAGGLFATRTQVGKRIAALLDGPLVSRRQLTVLSAVGVLLLAAGALTVGGAVRSAESEEAQEEPGAGYRVLRFPIARMVGMICVRQPRPLGSDWRDGWEAVGPAKGSVRVPRGKDVWLQVTEQPASDLRWLSALAPDDVQVLNFGDTPPDAAAAQLTRLSGLKWLVFYDRLPRGAGFAYLSRLKSLEGLVVARSAITDDELGVLANRLGGLKSFRRLELGSTELTDAGLVHLENLQSLEEFYGGGNKLTGSGFSHLARLPALREVGFGSQQMGDAAVAHLAECSSLKRLTLNCPKITDAGIAQLAKAKSLEALKLHYVPLTDAGLAHLSSLKTLRELELQATQATDAGLAHLAKLTSLEVFRLPRGVGEPGQAQITDAGLAHLRGLKGLKRLWLDRPRYTGAGVQFLADLKSLESLHPSCGITDRDLAAIGGLTSLRELWIIGSPVTDEGLRHLSSLKSLNKLSLGGCKEVTTSGLAHLRGLPIQSLQLDPCVPGDSRLAFLEGLPELETLYIKGTSLRDEDLASVGKLTRLKDLRIYCQAIGDRGMAHLAGLTSLESLTARFQLTDEGLKHLANMKKLAAVQLYGDFTDRALRHLERLKSLQMLYVWTPNELSPAALERLKKSLPALHFLMVTRMRDLKVRPGVGQVAPAFAVKTLDGRPVRLQDYRGKVVLLYFWATSCKPCIASAPALKGLQMDLSRYKGFAMISLSLDDADVVVRQHVEQFALPWPQIRLGSGSEVAANYGVGGVPAYFVIGPDGKVLYTGQDWDQIRKTVSVATDR